MQVISGRPAQPTPAGCVMYISGVFFFVASLALVGACGYAVPPVVRAIRAWRRYRELRLVSCPETLEPAAVTVALGGVARAALRGASDVRLATCSRWPEREGCPQRCVVQLDLDPEVSKVRSIVEHWYHGKSCALCGKPVDCDGLDDWLGHRPALLDESDASHVTTPWDEVAPESLPVRFIRSHPVCWSCHEAEAFRREYPELVVERPPH